MITSSSSISENVLRSIQPDGDIPCQQLPALDRVDHAGGRRDHSRCVACGQAVEYLDLDGVKTVDSIAGSDLATGLSVDALEL